MSLEAILASQAHWAGQVWPGHSGKRAPSLEANLIVPMSREVREQFGRASGAELGTPNRPGKMYSLRSSSALAYNFFAPWIGHDLGPLARALGQPVSDRSLQFERGFPHGLPTFQPQLDVCLDNAQARPLAIECKFSEPYGDMDTHAPLDPKYFPGERLRWAELSLPQCQYLASAIGKGIEFRRLGAGQLLKHILGLAWTTRQKPRLAYVWFDTGSQEAIEHRDELARFGSHVEGEIDFTAVSYQAVFASICEAPEPMPGYFEYLEARYDFGRR